MSGAVGGLVILGGFIALLAVIGFVMDLMGKAVITVCENVEDGLKEVARADTKQNKADKATMITKLDAWKATGQPDDRTSENAR